MRFRGSKGDLRKLALPLTLFAGLGAVALSFLQLGMVENEGTSLCRSDFTFFEWFYRFPSVVEIFRIPYGYDFYEQQPLFYAILWAWKHHVGASKLSLRVLPFCFYALNVAAVVWIAVREKLCGRRVWLISLLTLVLPAFVTFGAYIREYSLLCLLSTLAFYAFFKLLDGKDETPIWPRALAPFLGLSLLAFATYFAYVGALVILGVALFASRRLTRSAQLALAGFFTVLLPYAFQRGWVIFQSRRYFYTPDWSSFTAELSGLLGFGRIQPGVACLALSAIGWVLAAWPSLRSRPAERALALMMGAAVAVFSLLKSFHLSEISSRYVCFIFPAGLILLVRQRSPSAVAQAGLAMLVLTFGFSLAEGLPALRDGAEPERTMSLIEQGLPPGKTVLYTNRLNDMNCRYGIYFNTLFNGRGKSLEFGFLPDGVREVDLGSARGGEPVRFLVDVSEKSHGPDVTRILESGRVTGLTRIEVEDGPYLYFGVR